MPSFRDKQFFEVPRARVVITDVNAETLVATGVARGNDVKYIIDLTTSVGANWVVPEVGEEWIITRVANTWSLERRGALQSAGAASMVDVPGGATVVEKDLYVNGDVIHSADAGPITSGINWSESTDWEVSSYWLRKRDNWINIYVKITYSGATETATANGNITDINGIAYLPSAWQPAFSPWLETARVNGLPSWECRISSGGRIDIVAGIPTNTLTSGTVLQFNFGYPASSS